MMSHNRKWESVFWFLVGVTIFALIACQASDLSAKTDPHRNCYQAVRARKARAVAKRNADKLTRLLNRFTPLGRFMLTSYKDGTRRFGDVATDTSVIPRGSVIVAEGMGVFYASDVGSAVNGKHLDVYRNEGDNHGNADYRLPGRPKVWIFKGRLPEGFFKLKAKYEQASQMASLAGQYGYPMGGRW